MRTNYIFIDYENVQPQVTKALQHECFRLFVFLGAAQKKLPVDLAVAMQEMEGRGKYVQIAAGGRNALDFHIAYYLGESVARDRDGYFHIVTKDKGYDPLIQHLKDRGLSAQRVESLKRIAVVEQLSASSPRQKMDAAVRLLRKMTGKPATTKTLGSTLASALFFKQLKAKEIEQIINGLRQEGWIVINGTKVTYQLPESELPEPELPESEPG